LAPVVSTPPLLATYRGIPPVGFEINDKPEMPEAPEAPDAPDDPVLNAAMFGRLP